MSVNPLEVVRKCISTEITKELNLDHNVIEELFTVPREEYGDLTIVLSKMFKDNILLNRFGFLAAFIAAVTPLPDDWAAIPLAIVGFNIVKFTLGFLVGKLTTCIVAGILGKRIIWLLEESMGIWGSIISFTGTIVLIVIAIVWSEKIEKMVLIIFKKFKIIKN